MGRPGSMRLSMLAKADVLWAAIWIVGMAMVLLWDVAFLNAPALHRMIAALANTILAGGAVVVLSLFFGWLAGTGLYLLERRGIQWAYWSCSFGLNVLRSIPQIVGLMFGYFVLTLLLEREILVSPFSLLFWMSATIALFTFLGIADLIRSRIVQFAAMDFYPAMLASGMNEGRIINLEILWRNSRSHLVHAMIGVFGAAVFLQCSIDYVISVGLSTDVSTQNFPLTLGGLLASLDSKQDILAIGTAMTDLSYIPELFFRHLQGTSVAFVLVFTLVCVYQIGNGFVRRARL